jgi:hypothetical protein
MADLTRILAPRSASALWDAVLFLLVPLLGFLPVGVTAQSVVGTIVEAETDAPLGTAYLTLTSVDGEIVGRTLSDAQGRFTLRAPAPGRYLVHAERIGRGSVVHGPVAVGDGEVVRIELRAETRAISLAGIQVTADQQCRLEPDDGVEMARVWEQARLVLQVEALTRAERTFRYQLSNYTRELDSDARQVVAQQTRSGGGYLDAPYVSAPVEDLLEEGWVREDPQDGGWIFFAPDAEVLLSDRFQEAHCFQLLVDAEDASLIGLAFRPVRRSTRPGIEGALWLDRETAELRHLTFRYTGFPGVATAGAPIPEKGRSGRVEFLELPGGRWVVNRWHIRMPVLDQIRGPRDTRIVLTGILEEGGEVTEIRGAGGAMVARLGRGTVEGTVVNGRTGTPLAGARVQLQGTEYEARSGLQGGFRLDGLRPGTYSLTIVPGDEGHFLGTPVPVQVTVEEDAPVQVELRTPPEATVVEAFCASDPPDSSEGARHRNPADPGMVEGLVSWGERGGAAAGLQVEMEERSTTLVGSWETGRLTLDTRETRTWTTTRGWYGLCARPSGDWDAVRFDTFRLRVRSTEGRELYRGFVLPAPHRIVTRDIVVR